MRNIHVKLAIRNLFRHRSSSLINIIGLSTGITCCLVMLIFVRYEVSFDSFHSQADKTFRVVQHIKFQEGMSHWNTTAYPLAEALRNDFSEFSHVTQTAGPMSQSFSVDKNGEVNRFEVKHVLYTDVFYPTVFDLNWIAGNATTAFKNPNTIILTQSLAKKIFGSEVEDPRAILGKTIQFENEELLTVTAIVDDAPGNINLPYDAFMTYALFKKRQEYQTGNWSGNYRGTTFVVLTDPTQEKTLETKINGWKKKYLKAEDDSRIEYFLQPLQEIHNETLYGSSPGSYIMPIRIVHAAAAVALFILIVAAANFVNLSTAQASIRSKEVGVRKVLGGTRLNLVAQFAGENILLIIVTLLISIALAQVAITQLNSFLSILNLRLAFQPLDALIVLATGGLMVILAAIYPSIVMASFKPSEALKAKSALQFTGGQSLRKSLIVFQFTIVQVFIIVTIIAATQMDYFLSKDQGYASEAIITMPAPEFSKLESFRERLKQNSDVVDVTFGSGPPMSVNDRMYGATFRTPGQSEEEAQRCEMKIAGLNYLQFYNLKLIAGRNFTAIKNPYDEFIVNEKLVKAMGWEPEESLGKVLSINGFDATVVGVVKDFHNTTLQDEITPCAFMNWEYIHDEAFIKIHPKGNPAGTLTHIEKTWKEFSPDRVYNFAFLDELMAKNYAVESLVFKGFTVFSILAILIGCLGLFGLMSFITLKKTKEVGIRKVLGASVAQIVTLFSKEFVVLIAIAFCIASPLAYYIIDGWLQHFAYRITLSSWMFISGGVVALVIAMVTVSYQSIKAGLANPVDSLRNE
jgi:ABC-type antimicrobial peptide transport system permease subunit